MTTGKFKGCCLCSNIDDLACTIAACCGKTHVILGKSEVHNGIIVGTDVHVDFGISHFTAFSSVKEPDIALLVANCCDGGIVTAC